MNNLTSITPPRVPLTDPKTGLISREWFRFFLSLFQASGSGTVPANPTTVVLTESPSTYVNTSTNYGDIIISGGGVTKLEYSRDGTNFYNTGSYYGMFSLAPNDQLRISYIEPAPTVTFISR